LFDSWTQWLSLKIAAVFPFVRSDHSVRTPTTLLTAQGKDAEADELLMRALEIQEYALGRDPDVSTSLYDLAGWLAVQVICSVEGLEFRSKSPTAFFKVVYRDVHMHLNPPIACT